MTVTTRKIFKLTVISDYPIIDELSKFFQSRVSILELAGDNCKQKSGVSHSSSSTISHKGKTEGKGFFRNELRCLIVLASTEPNNSGPCCQGNHVIPSCPQFKSWAMDERSH